MPIHIHADIDILARYNMHYYTYICAPRNGRAYSVTLIVYCLRVDISLRFI